MSLAVEPRIESPRIAEQTSGGDRTTAAEARAPGIPVRVPAPAVHLLLVFVTLVLVVDALIGEKGLMQSMSARRQYLETGGVA